MPTAAPSGDIDSFQKSPFSADGSTRDVYRKGDGPCVVVNTEMPGLSPMVFGFADRLVEQGLSVALPDLYGTAGRDPVAAGLGTKLYGVRSMVGGCISRDFAAFALDKTSPVAGWLRALARSEHERCGGPGVGAVGMCFSGGFALAMATDPAVIAPVMSQPSLPLGVTGKHKRTVDVSEEDLETIVGRCSAQGLQVMGLRFDGDPLVPSARFRFLEDRLGENFLAVELDQADGHPGGPLPKHHSVLTGDLIDEVGQPTRNALDGVLAFLVERLLPGDG